MVYAYTPNFVSIGTYMSSSLGEKLQIFPYLDFDRESHWWKRWTHDGEDDVHFDAW